MRLGHFFGDSFFFSFGRQSPGEEQPQGSGAGCVQGLPRGKGRDDGERRWGQTMGTDERKGAVWKRARGQCEAPGEGRRQPRWVLGSGDEGNICGRRMEAAYWAGVGDQGMRAIGWSSTSSSSALGLLAAAGKRAAGRAQAGIRGQARLDFAPVVSRARPPSRGRSLDPGRGILHRAGKRGHV